MPRTPLEHCPRTRRIDLVSMYVSLEGIGQDAMLEFARQRVGNAGPWPPHAVALGIYTEDGTLRAVLVTVQTYHGVVDMHFASDETRLWGNRSVLQMLFGYMFDYLGARRVQTCHPVPAKAHTSIILRLGFTVEGTLKDAIDEGVDGILFSMLREECAWLPHAPTNEGSYHGQK